MCFKFFCGGRAKTGREEVIACLGQTSSNITFVRSINTLAMFSCKLIDCSYI